MRTSIENTDEYTCATSEDRAALSAPRIRRSATPSNTYRWCVIAFNHVSGVDVTKAVWWYSSTVSANRSGRWRFGQTRYLIGRAPL